MMAQAARSLSTITPSEVAQNPYIQLAAKLTRAAQSMQKDADELASLLQANLDGPLSPAATTKLAKINARMDAHEDRFSDCFCQ